MSDRERANEALARAYDVLESSGRQLEEVTRERQERALMGFDAPPVISTRKPAEPPQQARDRDLEAAERRRMEFDHLWREHLPLLTEAFGCALGEAWREIGEEQITARSALRAEIVRAVNDIAAFERQRAESEIGLLRGEITKLQTELAELRREREPPPGRNVIPFVA